MNYCSRCVMPDTKPGVTLDAEGLCNACRANVLKRRVDWKQRHEELAALCDEIKAANRGPYDCIVPVSGGKNSWYQAWTMKNVYGMKVICVNVAAHLPTTEGIANLNSMVANLGVDLVKVTLKPSVIKALRRKAFLRQGEPNWPEHCSVFAGSANVAAMYNVPLIVWGEDVAVEFGGAQNKDAKASADDINKNDLIKDKTVLDWLDDDIDERDVFFYKYPSTEELRRRGTRSIYLGYYHFWDGHEQYEQVSKLGFIPRQAGPLSGNYLDYDNIDEKLCEINIWFKYIKFGFWRPTDQCCYHLWNQRMTRDEAVDVVNRLQDQFPKEYFQDFLRFHNVTEEQFWETAEKFRNQKIWKKGPYGWKLKHPLTKN